MLAKDCVTKNCDPTISVRLLWFRVSPILYWKVHRFSPFSGPVAPQVAPNKRIHEPSWLDGEHPPAKRSRQFQQLHSIFLTINVSNKSGHLLFVSCPQIFKATNRSHSSLWR